MSESGPVSGFTLAGEVVLGRALATAGAVLRVVVEDVGRADAPAQAIARVDRDLRQPLPAGAVVPFSVALPALLPGGHYAVRAHVDVSGSGQVEIGDQVSTQSHPVQAAPVTRGGGTLLRVDVKPVGR